MMYKYTLYEIVLVGYALNVGIGIGYWSLKKVWAFILNYTNIVQIFCQVHEESLFTFQLINISVPLLIEFNYMIWTSCV